MPKTKKTQEIEPHLEVGDEDIVAQVYEQRCPVGKLEPHPMNPNEGDVGFIKESIEANGFYGAVLAQVSTGFIIAGEHRWRAAIEAGRSTVPVFWKDCSDSEALRIMLVDNEAARRGKNNVDKLDLVLRNLADVDPEEGLAGSGFTLKDLERIEQDRQMLEPNNDIFADQYGIILECETETEQMEVFEKLTKAGYKNLRVIAV